MKIYRTVPCTATWVKTIISGSLRVFVSFNDIFSFSDMLAISSPHVTSSLRIVLIVRLDFWNAIFVTLTALVGVGLPKLII